MKLDTLDDLEWEQWPQLFDAVARDDPTFRPWAHDQNDQCNRGEITTSELADRVLARLRTWAGQEGAN